jgi:hydrogenase large subunit
MPQSAPGEQPKVFLPVVQGSQSPPPPPPSGLPTKIAIDPITRIEGHLRLEVEIDGGHVTDAWSAGMMFRGIELVLPGRDPREAWIYTQRICGVCTTVHAICSVRAVENALGITIPDNARIIRNLIEGAQFIQDHVIHFYHLHAPDWVDVVSALSADPNATSQLAKSISDWPSSSPAYFQGVRDRLQTFVNSGQLGIFANAYWGHPAYHLPPEGNLLAVAHYLEALDWQREIIKMHAILGGKNPHPQTYLVGGVAIPVDASSPAAINPQRITQLKNLATQALDFVARVYIPDLLLVASFYKEWASLGQGVGNYLSYGDFPTNASGDPSALWLPQGVVTGKNLGAKPGALDHTRIGEYVTHSWYNYAAGDQTAKHPWDGETQWNYTGPQPPFDLLDTAGKYSWLKAPRYSDAPMEVGPLARMVVAYAAGHSRVRALVDQVLSQLGVGPEALFSTLGRVAARGVETLAIAEKMQEWIGALETNMNNGNLEIHNGSLWDPATWPAQAQGWGITEAPRGALGHWVRIENGKIGSYQCVVPTTWNGSPRDAKGQRGPWEEALIGTPVADPEKPVEVLRTVHSFDPCMACAVHVVDTRHRELTRLEIS